MGFYYRWDVLRGSCGLLLVQFLFRLVQGLDEQGFRSVQEAIDSGGEFRVLVQSTGEGVDQVLQSGIVDLVRHV